MSCSASRPAVIVVLAGGLVSEVYATDPSVNVIVLDQDVEGADPDQRRVIPWPDGAFVATRDHPCVQSLDARVVAEVEAAPSEEEAEAEEDGTT